jgi:hypothetical protein
LNYYFFKIYYKFIKKKKDEIEKKKLFLLCIKYVKIYKRKIFYFDIKKIEGGWQKKKEKKKGKKIGKNKI